jgi:hypothetical protein
VAPRDTGDSSMLTDHEEEAILRGDLQPDRKSVHDSFAAFPFLRIAGEADSGQRERLEQAATGHSAERDTVMAAARRWNQFCTAGSVPVSVAMKTKAGGLE